MGYKAIEAKEWEGEGEIVSLTQFLHVTPQFDQEIEDKAEDEKHEEREEDGHNGHGKGSCHHGRVSITTHGNYWRCGGGYRSEGREHCRRDSCSGCCNRDKRGEGGRKEGGRER